ncbi:MAG: GTPase ObgE [Candidatus Omnitrophica bacterium]|nr:GTPase ObgE [Candidatus Omnitrophota bacterium]
MFIDIAKIYLKAGDGGNGCDSFERDRSGKKMRSNGGPGGKGGDIFFKVDENVHTLRDFQYRQHFESKRGGYGSSNNKTGAEGDDCVIKVPPGTIIRNFENGSILADLVKPGEAFLVCKGGKGGSGNSRFRAADKGLPGEEKTVQLELKLIADVGIIGYPNAGKSTLISRISHARPKIADYPFTTKEPVLGVAHSGDFEFVVADIPGLIEGAHAGRGLGDQFLRHIERTKLLVHLVDMVPYDNKTPFENYKGLNKELGLYSKALIEKPQIIVANKMDAGKPAKDGLARFKKSLRGKKVIPISALKAQGMEEFLKEAARALAKIKKDDEDA